MVDKRVCIYEKFGHCRLKHECKFHHPTDICKDDLCEVRNCNKRHPQLCKWYLNNGSCNFGDRCYFDHKRIIERDEMKKRIEDLEKMCSELHNKCEKVSEECRIVHNENLILKNESLSLKGLLEEAKNKQPVILDEPMELSNEHNKQQELLNIDSEEVFVKENDVVDNDVKDNLKFIENEILKIKEFVTNERMIKSNVEKCRKKFEFMRRKIKLMKIKTEKERVLIATIEEIFLKLDKTNFSSFKKLTVSELEKFLNQNIKYLN